MNAPPGADADAEVWDEGDGGGGGSAYVESARVEKDKMDEEASESEDAR